MVTVEQIDIDVKIPHGEVFVVKMQPYLELEGVEPFKLPAHLVDQQLSAIDRTLTLARSSYEGRSANFTLFPEYSVPGRQGIDLLDDAIRSTEWSNGSIIVAGIHGLTRNEFRDICEDVAITVSENNHPSIIPTNKWVNSCLIWVKEDNGNIKRYAQLKIHPSWPEKNVTTSDMWPGSSVYVFNCAYSNGHQVSLAVLICYDWVSSTNGLSVQHELLKGIQGQNGKVPTQLDWVFVIQHNDDPTHTSFLNSTAEFLTDRNKYPLVHRDRSVLFHCNTASARLPTKYGNRGFSACIFAPSENLDLRSCRPTICMQPEILRRSNILKHSRCNDIVFREMGQCAHRFKIKVPRFVEPTADQRTYPILDAEVHPIVDTSDPRISGGAIPGPLKWYNDSLDSVSSLAQTFLTTSPLFNEAITVHDQVLSEMRLVTDGTRILKRINWARCHSGDDELKGFPERYTNSDLWDWNAGAESKALELIVHTITNLGLVFNLNVSKSTFHGALVLDDKFVEILVIRGKSYSDCRNHFDTSVSLTEVNDPIVVVFSDSTNMRPTPEEYLRYYEVNPDQGMKFIPYHDLISRTREAHNKQDLNAMLNGLLPMDRTII